jgi:hypothetical protein
MTGTQLRRLALAGALALAIPASLVASEDGQKSGKDAKDNPNANRPKITLKAQPVIAMSPARVVLTAELVGGADDFEDFYCATVPWEWGDGTQSESTNDCPPYESGKSELKRHFTVEHVFNTGAWHVNFRLKRQNKTLGVATVSLQIRPGLRDSGQ